MQASDALVLVLAAGRGQRLGGAAKALLTLRSGETYLERIWATATAAGIARGAVVVGPPHGAQVAACARRLGLVVLDNPRPELGMASSIEHGFTWAATTGASGALLWPCDHPKVAPATITALLSAASAEAGAVPEVDGRGGHPALVARALFGELTRCQHLPEGARTVLRAAKLARIPVADPGCVLDIDLPGDAARAEAS
ncbi:MAG: NTP transferase domain-containing protein [Myxococcales bacterium]|nr:NTP transferase domain-containing protein [Myxococcales bacterium]